MIKKFLSILLLTTACSSAVSAHHGGDGNGGAGVSYITSQALSQKPLAFAFLPTYEKRRDSSRTSYPAGIEWNMNKQWFVFARTSVYTTRKFVDDDDNEKKRTHGYGNTDLTVVYRFNDKLWSTFAQSLLINFHFPTASVQKNLTEGFIKYEPNYILTYNQPLPQETTLQIFNQNGFVLLQRVQEHRHHEEAHQHDASETHHHDEPDEDETDDEESLEDTEHEHSQEAGHHHNHQDNDRTAYSFVWNAGVALINSRSTSSVELDWENNRWNYGDKNNLYFTPRSFITVTKNLQIGASVPIGLTQSCDRFKIIGFIEIGSVAPAFIQKLGRSRI